MIEHVFGFCTDDQREKFFRQLPEFERMIVDEGIILREILA
jgi:polyphosphate kinase 2 (PPK2 family)